MINERMLEFLCLDAIIDHGRMYTAKEYQAITKRYKELLQELLNQYVTEPTQR